LSAPAEQRTRVLFVCLGNSCRSPMAEAIAARLGSDVMETASAGLTALGEVQTLTTTTLEKNGYCAGGLRSTQLRFGELEDADIVVNMTGRAGVLITQPPGKVEDWDVEDPYGSNAATYQRVFEDIERRVAGLVERVRARRTPASRTKPGSGEKAKT